MNPLTCPDEVLGSDYGWRTCGEVMPPYGSCLVSLPHRTASHYDPA